MTSARPSAAPLVSFIVPTFNSQDHLAIALQSLAEQTCRDFELVISDGASRDDTLRVAQDFVARMPSMSIDSRPDRGVYDAINRGIAHARGDWVHVLGSDDLLHAPDTLATLSVALRESKSAVVYGDVIVTGPSLLGVPVGGRYAGPMSLDRLLTCNVCQQAIFYRRTLFNELGEFNLRYRVWADWDFNLRAAFREPLQWVDVVVSDYSTSGMSSTQPDPVFGREMPELLRRELARRPYDRRLWPLHRRLRHQAKALRQLGHWSKALRVWVTYALLAAKRTMAKMAGVGSPDTLVP